MYFQKIICCCCLRILKFRNRDLSRGKSMTIFLFSNFSTFPSAARSKTISVHWHQGTAETRFHNTTTSIRRAAKQTHQPLAQRQSLDRMSRIDSVRSAPAANGALRAPPTTATIELTNGALVSTSCRVQNASLR